jgi:protein ImuA
MASSGASSFSPSALKRAEGFDRVEIIPSFPLGLPSLDQALAGGLALRVIHEMSPCKPLHLGAATGFALGLCASFLHQRKAAGLAWISEDFALAEAGLPYGPGLEFFGLPLNSFLFVRAADRKEALWAMEESLRSPALGAVVMELASSSVFPLSASRRLALAAGQGTGLGLVLHHKPNQLASTAYTRWEIGGHASLPDEFGGLGRTSFFLSLSKNRRGPLGQWAATWNPHDKTFSATAHARAVVSPISDRPFPAPAFQGAL